MDCTAVVELEGVVDSGVEHHGLVDPDESHDLVSQWVHTETPDVHVEVIHAVTCVAPSCPDVGVEYPVKKS